MTPIEFKCISFPQKEYLTPEIVEIVAKEFGIVFSDAKKALNNTSNEPVYAHDAKYLQDRIKETLDNRVKELQKTEPYRNQVLCRNESPRKTYYAGFLVENVINNDLYRWLCDQSEQYQGGGNVHRKHKSASKKKYDELREKKGESPEDWEPYEYRTEFSEDSEEQELEFLQEQYERFVRAKTDIVIDFVYDKYTKDRPMPDISISDVKCCLSCVQHTANTAATISSEAKEALAAQGMTFVPLDKVNQVTQLNSQEVTQVDIDTAIELALRQKKLDLVINYVCTKWIEIDEELLKHDIGYSKTADSNPGSKHIYKDVFNRRQDLSRYYKIREKS